MVGEKPKRPSQKQFFYVFKTKSKNGLKVHAQTETRSCHTLNQRFSDAEHREKLRTKLLKQLSDFGH